VKTIGGGPAGGTVIVLADREPDNLNPITYDSNPAHQVVHLLFRALARRDSTLSGYTPDLLERWEMGADSVSLTLHVRPGLKWHDGRPVTARDVVFTIRAQGSDEVASSRKGDVEAVASATARDSLTVDVKLNRTGPAVVNSLLEVVPAPAHLLESTPLKDLRFAAFNREPVGNGIFRFAGWKTGQQIVLQANVDAPEGRPALDRLVMQFIPDVTGAMTTLLSGGGDVLKIPTEQASQLAQRPTVKLYHAPRVRPAWIAWHVEKPPVDDARVRRAVLMGVNREEIVRRAFGDEGEVALSVVPTALKEYSDALRPVPFDPAGAGRLLDEAGWRDTNRDGIRDRGGQPLRLTVDYNATHPDRRDVLVAMQAQLRGIGVDLVPQPFESTAWVSRLRKGDFQGSFWGWGWGPGVMGPNAKGIFHSASRPPNGPNFARYTSPRADALIDSILVTFDEARSKDLWLRLNQTVTDDAAYAPIYLDPEYFGVSARIANVKFRGIEWWEDVAYWYIPTDKRIPRDRTR
jgi:peptide/nickel transport system substrate-binding protein